MTRFAVVPAETVEAPGTLLIPGRKLGEYQKLRISVTFRRLERDQLRELGERLRGDAGQEVDPDDPSDHDLELLKQYAVDWSGFDDVDGQSIDFNDAALRDALKIPSYRKGLVQLFFQCVADLGGLEEKNSGPSAGRGPGRNR